MPVEDSNAVYFGFVKIGPTEVPNQTLVKYDLLRRGKYMNQNCNSQWWSDILTHKQLGGAQDRCQFKIS